MKFFSQLPPRTHLGLQHAVEVEVESLQMNHEVLGQRLDGATLSGAESHRSTLARVWIHVLVPLEAHHLFLGEYRQGFVQSLHVLDLKQPAFHESRVEGADRR